MLIVLISTLNAGTFNGPISSETKRKTTFSMPETKEEITYHLQIDFSNEEIPDIEETLEERIQLARDNKKLH